MYILYVLFNHSTVKPFSLLYNPMKSHTCMEKLFQNSTSHSFVMQGLLLQMLSGKIIYKSDTLLLI